MTTIIAHPFANGLPFDRNVSPTATTSRFSRPAAAVAKRATSAFARLSTRLEREDSSDTRLDSLVYGSLALAGIAWPAYECIRAILAS